jgi:hypothetical protein
VTARCAIPDWLEPLLTQARADLATAESRQAERAAQRQQLADAVDAAERTLREVAAATAADRDALASAVRRADRARWNHADAQRQLDAAPRGMRRRARHDVNIAEGQLERADAYLQRTRQRTAPSIDRYQEAKIDSEHAHGDLRRHDNVAWLDTRYDIVNVRRRRVGALETWRSWATGDYLTVRDLADAIRALNAHGSGHLPEHSLARSIETWATSHHVQLNPGQRIETTVRQRGEDIAR